MLVLVGMSKGVDQTLVTDGPFVDATDASVCNQVYQMADELLAQIPIGTNVTLRPGLFVTGIASDPKRYAVSKGRVLHWLETIDTEYAVFGTSFTSRLALRPDAMFVNYFMGNSIVDRSQYSVAAEFAASNIDDELGD